MNTEFQRIARRDDKAFLSNQCKDIDEKNRMGKTRDLFKKIRGFRMGIKNKIIKKKKKRKLEIPRENFMKRWAQ